MPEKDTSPRLGYVILYVPHVTRAVEFYERAFGLARRFVHESGEYAELDTGDTALAFADETTTSTDGLFVRNRLAAKAAGAEVGLVVSDVPAAFARAVEAGAQPALAPVAKPWGQTVSYVRDLNGFLVEICSPVTG